jgi:hypothetical protein
MSYTRIKKIGNNSYLYEQESYRDEKGVHTRHVRYIGKVGISEGKGSLGTTKKSKIGTTKEQNIIDKSEFHSIHPSHDINPFDKRYEAFSLQRHMIITIPSTQGQRHISQKEIDSRAREVASKMTEDFGGSTRIRGEGTYVGEDKKVIGEKVVKVEVFMDKKEWNKQQPKVQKYLIDRQKQWKQETLGVEYDRSEALYFLRAPTNDKK